LMSTLQGETGIETGIEATVVMSAGYRNSPRFQPVFSRVSPLSASAVTSLRRRFPTVLVLEQADNVGQLPQTSTNPLRNHSNRCHQRSAGWPRPSTVFLARQQILCMPLPPM
jgi:hypothetical protein